MTATRTSDDVAVALASIVRVVAGLSVLLLRHMVRQREGSSVGLRDDIASLEVLVADLVKVTEQIAEAEAHP